MRLGGCCWLRGKVAAAELEALREHVLSERMFDDMDAGEAMDFGVRLGKAADDLERRHASKRCKPKGAWCNGTWNRRKEKWVNKQYSSFEQAIASIREAAQWYSAVGRMGCSVHAWY